MYRYAELRPDQLAAALRERPLAIVPWGALEWHGPHLPLGLDGIVAEGFAEQLAERTRGVLLPTFYLPITTLPHRFSLQVQAETVLAVWRELLAQLGTLGFKAAALISGHYAHPHEILITQAADESLAAGLPVLSGPPLAVLGDPTLLDHAARWETSQLLALRPDLVELGQLDQAQQRELHTDLAAYGVLGEDPRESASPAAGAEMLGRALAEWERWLQRLLAGEDLDALRAHHAARSAAYADYVRKYFTGSWEQSLQQWWSERQAQMDVIE